MNPNFFNLSKRKKRDILSELLTGNPSDGIISKKELVALTKAIGETSRMDSSRRKKSKMTLSRKKRVSKKEKKSYYLSAEVIRGLDSVTKEIQSYLPENQQPEVTKSRVVDQALTLVLEEFSTRGENSRLFRSILHEN